MGRRVAMLTLVLLGLGAAPAQAERFSVTSFDGTRIEANFFAAEGLQAGQRAPTVLYGPGYSSGGDDDPQSESSEVTGAVGVGPLRRAGYNVVTWDPRGFGQSGGTVQIDSPEHEARDVQAIVDAIAGFPQVLLDGPGDPRVGMTGVSYGGGIQFNTAQREPRIDAIAPTIAWHSLITSLFKDGALKAGWGLVLCGAGEGRGLAEGIFAPGGPQTGGHDPVVTRTCVNGVATGKVPPREDLEWFAARGPGELVGRIRIPTLIVQGTVDTLFTLREAMDNHAILRRSGVPLKMMWFCGGHGACFTGSGEAGHVERRVVAWLDRHLRGRDVDTGPAFEWVADDGRWRAARGFPLPEAGRVTGSASGSLALEPSGSPGTLIASTPAPPGRGFDITLAAVPAESDVLGEPTLRLTYSGTGSEPSTHVYAQVVDAERGRVAGNLVTPIPLVLDGREHTVERALEPVALRAPAGKRYRVQLVSSTTVYEPSRMAGSLVISRAEASLPIVDAGAAAPSAAERRGAAARPACRGSRVRGFRKVAIRGGRRLRFRVLRHRARAFRVEIVRRRDGRRVARVTRRPGSFGFGRRVRPGRYLVRVIMPLSRGRRDVRQARARYSDGRWTVSRVRFAGSC